MPIKRAGFLLLVLLVAASCGVSLAQDTDLPWHPTPMDLGYTLTPWPYGLLVAPDELEMDTDEAIDLLMETIEFVCDFWCLPMPSEFEGWEQALESRHCPGEVPGYQTQLGPHLNWLRCPSAWMEGGLIPLAVVVFASHDDLARAAGTWAGYAYFGTVSLGEGMAPMLTESIAIPYQSFQHGPGILAHEIVHWLQHVFGPEHVVLSEGMARRTEDAWEGDNSFQRMAAVFAESGSLLEVPWPLAYDVGASFTDYVWSQSIHDRVELWESSCSRSTNICEDYEALVDYREEGWRASLSGMEPTEADRVLLEAKLQELTLVQAMLKPVLSQSASDVLSTIYVFQGTQEDLAQFWDLISVLPIEPDEAAWQALEERERTLLHVAMRNAEYAAPPSPSGELLLSTTDVFWLGEVDPGILGPVLGELADLREAGDWPGYYGRYVELLREIIAEGTIYPDLIPWWDPATDRGES